MKKIFSVQATLGPMLFFFGLLSISACAQEKQQASNDTLPAYQKNPTLPAFNIRLMDSVTVFNTFNIPEGKPVALMLLSPDCKHCKATVKVLLQGMDSIKNVQFYMVTSHHNLGLLRHFYEEFHLADYKNIQIVGRDYEFFFPILYKTTYVPDIALYDEHKKFVVGSPGTELEFAL